MQKVLLRWQAGSLSGWGLLGLNLFEHWASDPDVQPIMGVPLDLRAFPGISPLRYRAMRPLADASNRMLEAITTGDFDLREHGLTVIDPFGNGLSPANPHAEPSGMRNVARAIFENTQIDDTRRIADYDSVLCASEWAGQLLRASTTLPVKVIHEGIDHSQFFPGPRSGVLDADCFYVFSGGKIEFRKGQDLVIRAFRQFAARHDDTVLVTAWHSPWPSLTTDFATQLSAPLRADANGVPQISRWAEENGIPARQFIELPLTANSLMAAVLREMDCALQVSRSEACTNLVAMEAMACAVPVILANNTGVRDLIDADNCVALNAQEAVDAQPGLGTAGWGESEVEDIVAALEQLYSDTEARKRIGARGAAWILEHQRTWRDHAGKLKAYLHTLD